MSLFGFSKFLTTVQAILGFMVFTLAATAGAVFFVESLDLDEVLLTAAF